MGNEAPLAVIGLSFVTIVLGMVYFRRWQLTRPPIGVFNLGDVAFMLGGILLVPLLYLAVPTWLLLGLMALGALSAIYVAAEPIVKSAWACWLLLAMVAAAEAWAAVATEPASQAYFLVNNVVVIACVIGVSNLWAQSGMKARDAAILGGALAVYDLVATGILPLMGDLMARTATMPFGPVVGWRDGSGESWALIGMGDLLVSTMFPLVMRKAYGRTAGMTALALSGTGIVVTFGLIALGITSLFPVMVVVGPSMVLQYAWWSRRTTGERTTRAYLMAEPIG
jgi:hypothetical protein